MTPSWQIVCVCNAEALQQVFSFYFEMILEGIITRSGME